jgi:hypothetical protein
MGRMMTGVWLTCGLVPLTCGLAPWAVAQSALKYQQPPVTTAPARAAGS